MSNEPIEGDVLDTMPATTEAQGQQLATTSNPFERMAMVAMETGRGIDQLERLLDLQIKWDGEQARKAYVAAMAAFKAEPIEILKRKQVSFNDVSYKHEELADVTEAVVPAMARHGLSHDWSIDQDGSKIRVSCTITHRDGHSGKPVTMEAAPDASGKKNAIQQVASAIKYMQRYTLLAATGTASKSEADDDGREYGANEIEYISEEQEVVLRDLMDAYVPNKKAFGKWISSAVGYEVAKLMEIPADKFDTIHAELKRIALEKSNAS